MMLEGLKYLIFVVIVRWNFIFYVRPLLQPLFGAMLEDTREELPLFSNQTE